MLSNHGSLINGLGLTAVLAISLSSGYDYVQDYGQDYDDDYDTAVESYGDGILIVDDRFKEDQVSERVVGEQQGRNRMGASFLEENVYSCSFF